MNQQVFKKGDRIVVTVEKVVFDGPGVVHLENGLNADGSPRRLAVFIEGVAPGDEVEIELSSTRRGVTRGFVKKYIKLSQQRAKPKCPHFGIKLNESGEPETVDAEGRPDLSANCGGCTWQFLKYEDQLKIKSDEVWNALLKIGGVAPEVLEKVWRPIMAAESPWGYRNKMDFSITSDREGKRHIGLHMKGRYYDVTEIHECLLFRPWVGEFLDHLRPFLQDCPLGEEGIIKSLIVRAGTNSREVLVNLVVENATTDWAPQFTELVKVFFESLPGQTSGGESSDRLVSVYLTRMTNKKGQPNTLHETLMWGKPTFDEFLNLPSGALRFEVAPQAFLQPNTRQAERIYSLVAELAYLTGRERVFDLFCGTGTIGISLAKALGGHGRVTGLELNAPAVENARRNAALNGVKNIDFMVGDVNKLLPEMGAAVDLIVVDPPRAGLTAKIIESIAATAAPRLIYVSCNPRSLARDLNMLLAHGFRLSFVQSIDQFSQTYHTETVTMLER